MKYKSIIWDYNGTLLNDSWLTIEIMNGMLKKRKLPLLTLERYHQLFDFPVKDYYQRLGFDFEKEPFEIVGEEFIVEYDKRHLECKLHNIAFDILQYFNKKGVKQYILSARNQQQLVEELKFFRISKYFESVAGLSDNLANGKEQLGQKLLATNKIDPKQTILIGDTTHDFEVANKLDVDCILVEGGHHSRIRLNECGCRVLIGLEELMG